jgi:hypothetical protein
MEKFWMVWNPNGHAPTRQHPSRDKAMKEPERLARLDPNEIYFVLEAQEMCQKQDILWTNLQELPF